MGLSPLCPLRTLGLLIYITCGSLSPYALWEPYASVCCIIVGSLLTVSVCFLRVCVGCLGGCFECLHNGFEQPSLEYGSRGAGHTKLIRWIFCLWEPQASGCLLIHITHGLLSLMLSENLRLSSIHYIWGSVHCIYWATGLAFIYITYGYTPIMLSENLMPYNRHYMWVSLLYATWEPYASGCRLIVCSLWSVSAACVVAPNAYPAALNSPV